MYPAFTLTPTQKLLTSYPDQTIYHSWIRLRFSCLYDSLYFCFPLLQNSNFSLSTSIFPNPASHQSPSLNAASSSKSSLLSESNRPLFSDGTSCFLPCWWHQCFILFQISLEVHDVSLFLFIL